MKVRIPLTGKVTEYHPELDGLSPSGGISGDLDNPIKPIPINLGNVSWKLVGIDLENDLAEIEVEPSDIISVDTGKLDGEGNPIYETREATEQEKQGFLDYAKNQVESHTVDELYTMTKAKRLVKPAGAVKLYKQKPPNES